MKHAVIVILLFMATTSYSQNVPTKDNALRPAEATRFPSRKEISKRERIALKKKTTVDLQQEYYDRVKTVMKERRKAARIMQRPQYFDPMYFGHRRPPKKHSPDKMRYCRECGIRH